jgi:tight adherence protein C
MAGFEFSTPGLVFLALVLLGIGALVTFLSFRWLSTDRLEERLNDFVAEEVVTDSRANIAFTIQTREISGSVASRLLLPLFKGLTSFIGRLTPASTMDEIRAQLMIAGNPMGLGAREFFGVRMISVAIGLVLGIFFFSRGITSQLNVTGGFGAIILFFFGPMLWLKSRVSARQRTIRKGLPDALDLLTVCATAGLGFDQAMQRVSEQLQTPIAAELARVISEMEMGLSRRDALRNLSERLRVQELSSFVSFILQSDQLGMSISDTLHAQADQMRIERRFRAQEQAQTIPSKMLIPMAFLIFPALLAIILGPAIPRLTNLFGNL